MKKTIKNICFLFKHSFKISKKNYLIKFVNNLFRAFTPFINIIGLGNVISALENGKSLDEVINIIIIYVSINFIVVFLREILQLLDNNIERKISNVMQFEYSYDSVNIDYQYVQDRTILNLRRKSMNGHPAGNFLYYISDLFFYIFQLIGVIYIFATLSPLFIIVLLITSLLSILLVSKTKKNNFEFQNEKVEEDRKLDYLYRVMTEYEYAKEVRINNAEAYVNHKYVNIFTKQIGKLKTLFRKSLKLNTFGTIITVVQTIFMYFYFSYFAYHKSISIAEYTILLSTTTLFVSLILGFFDNIVSLILVSKSADFYIEYKELIESNQKIIESNHLGIKEIDFSNPLLKFENVTFIYEGTNKTILKNINLEIKKGEKIGLVGLNGSGKTTFVKLLTRLYDPTYGSITLNGINISEIPYHQYIKHIGVLLQDYTLFAYSIKENIILNSELNEEKLASSIKNSGLYEKVSSLENGIFTSVYKKLDEKGVELSGGEGQKLALARAIYKDAEVLILDEPTSALDPIAEFDFYSKISDISKSKITIFISHRLSSTKSCDKIIVLSEGEIIESGSHQDLLDLNGMYADLFKSQAKYYQDKGVIINE